MTEIEEAELLKDKLRLVTTSFEMSNDKMKVYRALLSVSRSILGNSPGPLDDARELDESLVEKYLEKLDELGIG